jgi:hypothetical protein
MNNFDRRIRNILALLGEGSRFLDDDILLGDEEEKVLLFAHKGFLLTVHDGGRLTYWEQKREYDPSYVRHYCGLRGDDDVFERDIFLAGYYDPVTL